MNSGPPRSNANQGGRQPNLQQLLALLAQQGHTLDNIDIAALQRMAGSESFPFAQKPQVVEEVDKGPPINFMMIEDDPWEQKLVKFFQDVTLHKSKIDSSACQFAREMLIEAFGRKDFAEYLKELYKDKPMKTGLCRKLLKNNVDVGYQCLDCQKDPTCIICSACFDKSNHTGHRIFLKQSVSGMCDCGDRDAWEEKGNCSEHTGFVEEDNVIPVEMKEKLIQTIKQTFCFIFQSVEVLRTEKFRYPVSYFLKYVLELLMELCGVYTPLTPVIGRALYTSIRFSSKPVLFHHDPSNRDGRFEILPKPQQCDSSILSLLLRYNTRFIDETQKTIQAFLVSLFVDYEFKKVFAVEYVKYSRYYYDIEKVKAKEKTKEPRLLSLSIQILTSEELGYLAIRDGDMEGFLDSYLQLHELYVQDEVYKPDHYLLFHVGKILEYCLVKKSGVVEFFKNPTLVKKYFAIVDFIQRHGLTYKDKVRPDMIDGITEASFSQVEQQVMIIDSFMDILGVIITLDKETKNELFMCVLEILKEYIMKPDGLFQDIDCRFVMPLERCFIIAIVAYNYFEGSNPTELKSHDIELSQWIAIHVKIFASDSERKKFWEHIASSFASMSGFLREILRNAWVSLE